MANRKINELITRTPSLSDLILVGDPSSGYSYKATVTALATIIETDIADGFVTLSTTQTISGAKTFTNAVLISANSPELNINQGSFSASYINFKENSSLINRILSSGAALTFITNNSGTPALVLSSSQTATFGSIPNATIDTDKFLVSDGGVLKYRTGAEVLSDIGAASSSNISGTTNYIAKFTSSSAIGNSVIYESGGNIGIGTTTLTARLTVNGNVILSGSINATETYLSSPNGLVFQINSTNANGGYAEFQTSSTTIGRIGTATQVVGSGGASVFAISSVGANDFILGTNGTQRVRIDTSGNVTFSQIANATVDTDKFLVSDSGVIKYRTGAEVLSDIGGASSASISGTTNYIPKFTSSSAIGNSVLYELSGNIGLGTTNPSDNIGYGRALDIQSSTGAAVYLRDSDATTTQYAFVAYDGNDNGLKINNQNSSGFIRFSPNGTEGMRLTSTGLGIGTSSPTSNLDILGSSSRLRLDGSSASFQILSRNTANSSTNPLIFDADTYTFNRGGVTRMLLDASGNLGLGVTPSAWGSIFTALQIKNTSLSAVNGIVSVLGGNSFYNGTSYTYIQNGFANQLEVNNSGSFLFQIAPSGTAGNAISFTQAMTLNASGRLLLGTTSDDGGSRLQVNGKISAGGASESLNGLSAVNNSAGQATIYSYNYNASGYSIYSAQGINYFANNVGIGTTSPNYLLDLQTTSTTLTSNLKVSAAAAANNYAEIAFQLWSGAGSGLNTFGGSGTSRPSAVIRALSEDNSAKGALLFATFNGGADNTTLTEKMRITSAGNVGIGTTSPSAALQIFRGAFTGNQFKTYAELQSAPTTLSYTTSDGFGLILNMYEAVSGSPYTRYADIVANTGDASDSAMRFFTKPYSGNAAERLRITSGGELLINTTSDAGDYKLQVNGNSIMKNLVIDGANNSNVSIINYLRTDQSWSLNNETNFRFYTSSGNTTSPSTQVFEITTGGAIKTAAPSGGTAKPFKIGAAAVVSPTSPNRTIEIEIDGTTYYLSAKTTNN